MNFCEIEAKKKITWTEIVEIWKEIKINNSSCYKRPVHFIMKSSAINIHQDRDTDIEAVFES